MSKQIYHFVKCPGSTVQRCRCKIKLEITDKDYGKKVAVKCPECDVEFTTTLVRPVERPKNDDDSDPISDFLGIKWPFSKK